MHWIVQYDLPPDPKEYVHRVGRAARLGQQGQALIMLHPSEAPFLELLQQASPAAPMAAAPLPCTPPPPPTHTHRRRSKTMSAHHPPLPCVRRG